MQGHYHWRLVFVPPAFLGILVSLYVLNYLKLPRDLKIEVPGQVSKSETAHAQSREASSFLGLLSVPAAKELAVSAFCLKFVRYCMYMWLPMYFVEHLGYSQTLVSLVLLYSIL